MVVQELRVGCNPAHQVHRADSQLELLRSQVMARRLLHPCCKPLRVVLQEAPQKECVLQDLVRADLAARVPVVQVDQAERRSHQPRYGFSHSWVTCSSADRSM